MVLMAEKKEEIKNARKIREVLGQKNLNVILNVRKMNKEDVKVQRRERENELLMERKKN